MNRMANGSLGRFLAPDGAPQLTRSLAWRRTLERWALIHRRAQEAPQDQVLAYVVAQIPMLSATGRHAVLGSPDGAAFVHSHVTGRQDATSDLAVLGAVHAERQPGDTRTLALQGSLVCRRQGVGRSVIIDQGSQLDGLSITLEDKTLSITARVAGAGCWRRELRRDGLPTVGAERRAPIGEGAWELVDGWSGFENDFDDGNESPLLDETSRVDLTRALKQAWSLLVAIAPGAAEEMQETARYVRPLRPRTGDTIPSFSSRDLPGVIFVGTHRRDGVPIEFTHLVESCFHEHLHNRLYLLESAYPLTVPETPPRCYWSPWKTADRGIDGMVHAIYVFAHLTWFWRRAATLSDAAIAKVAIRRSGEHFEALREALRTIATTTELAPAGEAVIAASQNLLEKPAGD
ncbi:MAG: hypothetical protein E6J90_35315 [Deltaproteobacteria bacterium]|nr:MAG: hypothetical protein E6J90_35315 [Deltaproteobacteria bacterium]